MKISVFSPSFLAILFTAVATLTLPARAELERGQIDSAAARIAEILKPRIEPLDREAMTFHYIDMDQPPIIHSQTEIVEWAAASANMFFDLDATSGDMQGVGLYNAIDPHSSRSYGGNHPVLFVLPLQTKTRILDLASDRATDDGILDQLRSIADTEGCKESGSDLKFDSVTYITRVFRNSSDRGCREIITQAYRRLGVQAIMYGYSSDQFRVGCRERGIAFNVIDPTAISIENSALFWDTGRFAPLTLARKVAQTFNGVSPDFYTRYARLMYTQSKPETIGSLEGLGTFERSAQSWRKRTFISCGPKWSIEVDPPKLQLIFTNLTNSFSDDEIKQAILDWHKAYVPKFNVGGNFDVSAFSRVRKIEQASFTQTTLPQDAVHLANWQKAGDLLQNYNGKSEELDAQLEILMEEPVPRMDFNALAAKVIPVFDELYKQGTHQQGLIGAIYRRIGYGPRVTQLKIRQWLMYGGSEELVAIPLPDDATLDYTVPLKRNKEAFLKLLGSCTEMMNSPATVEEIQASDCAVRPHN